VDEIEASLRDEPCDPGACALARVEERLERPRIAHESAGQGRSRAGEAEAHHLDPDPERGERGHVGRGRLGGRTTSAQQVMSCRGASRRRWWNVRT
jgi:hypothetical protein